MLSRFGRQFKKWYHRQRGAGVNPATAFDATLAHAAREVGYSGWPVPQKWRSEAVEIAYQRDGESFWEAVAEKERDQRERAATRCWWCNRDEIEEPFSDREVEQDGVAHAIHASCLKEARERGVLDREG